MSFKVITIQGRVWMMCGKCQEADPFFCKTIWKLFHNIAKLEDIKYPNGEGWEYFAKFLYDCCNPDLTYEELEKKYALEKSKGNPFISTGTPKSEVQQ